MKGDFSRIRFNPINQYTSVLQQQGRVGLDADANEQCAINEHLRNTETKDVVGPYGGPIGKEGFKIAADGPTKQILIGAGRYYVHGILCENEQDSLPYADQSFLINPNPTDDELLAQLSVGTISTIQVYLEVWQRLVTALDDPCLREPALGQADTTARLQTVWRVVARGIAAAQPAPSIGPARTFELSARRDILRKAGLVAAPEMPIFSGVRGSRLPTISLPPIHLPQPQPIPGPSRTLGDCCADMYQTATQEETLGCLSAQTSDMSAPCSCEPTPPAGYRGLENQLYRVEIHQAGDENSATCKWSRENGSVVVAVTGVSGRQVIVDSLGPDANLGFASGQWVEITDDTDLFGSIPNQTRNLYQIQTIDPGQLTMTMTEVVAAVNPKQRAKVRRWDQFGSSANSSGVALSAGSWLDLENGIQVQFTPGQYESGDYWVIPARTASGQIEWPPCGSNGGMFQIAQRVEVHRAPLACIQWNSQTGEPAVHDCRKSFSPLTDLTPAATVPAFHVSQISWRNDDIMTLDQLIAQPIAGTVTVVNGSDRVTGTRTAFNTSLQPGQWLVFSSNATAPYQIKQIVNDKTLLLSSKYQGGSQKSTTAAVSGLSVTFDQPAPVSSYATPATFIVSLEVAIPLPLTTSPEIIRGIRALPGPLKERLMSVTRARSSTAEAAATTGGAAASAEALAAVGGVQLSTVIREELLLDGVLSSSAATLAWRPFPSSEAGFVAFAFIDDLLLLGARQRVFSRVRVRLLGRMLFSQNSSGKQLFLDGQSFGMPAADARVDGTTPRIDVQLPSGNEEKASDFESWFYLAPRQVLTTLVIDHPSLKITSINPLTVIDVNNPNAGSVSPQAVVSLAYPALQDTTMTLSIVNLSKADPTGILSIPSSVTVPRSQTQVAFPITIQGNTGSTDSQSWQIIASLITVIGTSSAQASVSITGLPTIG